MELSNNSEEDSIVETATPTELVQFHQFLGQQVADRNVTISPEQAVALWRHRQQENEVIREGLRAVEEGRTRPIEEFIDEFRQRHQIPEDV
jgi:predicted transcriptional regulator